MKSSNPIDIRSQQRRQDEDERARLIAANTAAEDFKWLMGDARGRRYVWRLLEQAGVFRSSFTGNSETFFKEGARSMGLAVVSQINEHTPELYQVMLTENQRK
jgi:hypothetical protein